MQEEMKYSITDEHIESERYIEFLKQLIEPRQRPLTLARRSCTISYIPKGP
jgi:hypothetical protein